MIRNTVHMMVALAAIATVSSSLYADGFGRRGWGSNYGGSHVVGGGLMSNPNVDGVGHRLGWVYHSSWGDYWARNQAAQTPWHGEYYWLKTGQPTALIVPPTVTMQANHSWGVSQNTMTPVYHQFGGGAPNGSGGGVFKATPYWPSHSNQFGVYPVRGPWN